MSTSGPEKTIKARAGAGAPLVIVLELFRATSAADPHAFVFQTQSYHRRLAGGVLREASCPWEETLFDLLSSFTGAQNEREAARRFGEALHGFLRALDWSRDEAAIERALEEGRPVEIMLRLEAAELFSLPWELLTLGGSGAPLGELPHVTIRYQWPGTSTAKRAIDPPSEGGRLLFAWSAAGGVVPAEGHLDALASASRASVAPGVFDRDRDVLGSASYRALSRALEAADNEGKPFTVLHLLCHGGQSDADPPTFGLALNGDGREPRAIIEGATLAALLRPHAEHLRLVVVSACQGADPGALGNHLGSVAQELHRAGIEAVVASRFPLGTEASAVFTHAFYKSLLVDLTSVEAAFIEARRLVQKRVAGLDHLALQLHARETDMGVRPVVVRPYRGLLVFDREHRGFLFGRDAEVLEVGADLSALRASHRPLFLVVAGASGTGKSSLVRAGAVPAILDHDGEIEVVMARPSKDLDDTLKSVEDQGPSARRLILVDQFEEIFTHIQEPRAREALVRRLWDLARAKSGHVAVILTLRVDFIGRCGEITVDETGLRLDSIAYDEAHRIFVAQMARSQLEETIIKPAARVGLSFDDGLVRAMLEEVGEEPGALPLVEYALDQIWLRREGNRLTQKAYEAIGGVSGALQKQADALLDALDEPAQKAARRLLVRLVGTAGDGSIATRRRVPVEEIRPLDDERARSFDAVLGKLSDARLLVRDWQGEKASVEVAHEALIRRWDRLRVWVEEDRKKLAEIEQVEAWEQNQTKFTEALLTGDALGYARQVQQRYPGEIGATTLEFIAKSEEADSLRRERDKAIELEKQALLQRDRRRAVIVAIGAIIATILSVVVGIWIYINKTTTEKLAVAALKAGEIAKTKEEEATLAAQRARTAAVLAGVLERLGAGQPQWASRLLIEGPNTETTPDWITLAHQILGKAMPERFLRGHSAIIRAAAFSPDNKSLLTTSRDGTALLWSADGKGDPITFKAGSINLDAIAWSPDARRFVVATGETVSLWTVDGKSPPKVFAGHAGLVRSLSFSIDGKHFASASDDTTARLWDTDGNDKAVVLEGHSDAVVSVAYSPDGRRVATASEDGTARIWDVDGKGKPAALKGHEGPLTAIAWSPDGERVATASMDRTVRVWSADGKGKPVVLRGHDEAVVDVRFGPDGKRLISVSTDKTARVWDAAGKGQPTVLRGHRDWVTTGYFSPDGKRVLTASTDGSARIWDADGRTVPVVLTCNEGPLVLAKFSPNGERIVTAAEEGTACLWDASVKNGALVLGGDDGSLFPLTRGWDRLGERVATSSIGQVLQVWDVDEHARAISPPMIVTKAAGQALGLGFSPDGGRIAMASVDESASTPSEVLRVWNVHPNAEPLVIGTRPGHGDVVKWSPDSAHIATICGTDVCIWDTKGGVDPIVLSGGGVEVTTVDLDLEGRCVAWSRDGKRIAVALKDHTVRVFSADGSGAPIILKGHDDFIDFVIWSADSQKILTASGDKTARLWNADGTGSPIVFTGHESAVTSAVFSADGTRVLTTSKDRTARVYRVDGSAPSIVLEGHEGDVKGGAFSDDGSRVVTVSADKSVRIWRADGSGAPVILRGHVRDITAVTWSSDGDRILTAALDGAVRVWIPEIDLLKARLNAENDDCLPPNLRTRYLSETDANADAAYQKCERDHGRTPWYPRHTRE